MVCRASGPTGNRARTSAGHQLYRVVRLGVSSPVVLDVARAFQVTRFQVECCRDERFVKACRVNPKTFFAELKRRNVYKVAVAYTVVAWSRGYSFKSPRRFFPSSKF
jgi:hypothetical protein